MSELEKILILIEKNPPNLKDIVAAMNNNSFSKEELMTIAIKAAKQYELSETNEQYSRKLEEETDDEGWYIKTNRDYDPVYMDKIKKHPLVEIIELLLEKGMDPSTCLNNDDVNILLTLQYVDKPFLAATVMRSLLEYGADPYVHKNDDECFFWEIDGDMAIDINMLPESIVQYWFQCWIVMIGYGARPEKVEPFNLNPGHTFEELKDFEFFDYKVRFESDKGEHIMHIYDIRNGEEIGWI